VEGGSGGHVVLLWHAPKQQILCYPTEEGLVSRSTQHSTTIGESCRKEWTETSRGIEDSVSENRLESDKNTKKSHQDSCKTIHNYHVKTKIA
jgi:hypothetical protein